MVNQLKLNHNLDFKELVDIAVNNLVKSVPTLKKSATMVVQSVAGGLIATLLWILLARMMSISEFGEFSASFSMLGIAITISSLGMGTIATKIYSQSYIDGSWELSRGLRRNAPLFILGVSIICFVVLVGCHLAIQKNTAARLESFIAVIALLPLFALARFFAYTSSTHGAPIRASALFDWGWNIVALITLGVFVVVFETQLGALGVAGVFAISSTIILYLLWLLSIFVESEQIKHGKRTYSNSKWIRSGLAIAFAALSVTIIHQIGVIVLGWVYGNDENAAILSAAGKLSIIILLPVYGLGRLYRPFFAKAVAAKNQSQINKLLLSWIRTTFVSFFVLGGVLIIGGKFFLGLYGEEYTAGYWTLVVYVLGFGGCSLMYISRSLYQFLGYNARVLVIMVCTSVVGIAGMYVLGEFWSYFGVALATVITVNISCGLILLLCFRKIKQMEK